jgi:dTDP-4-dehydrorhamnose reductase
VELVPVDLETDDIGGGLDQADPDVVIHLAAISSAEGVRLDPGRGRRVNVEATRQIADWCTQKKRGVVFTSTDLVFDGTRSWSREEDRAEPVLAYGRTKRAAEPFVLAAPRGLVARVSLLYGFSRSGRDAYFDRTIAAMRRGEPQTLFEDEFRTPLDLATAARALVGLAEVGATGIVHLAGRERMSRYDLIRRAAIALGIDPALVRANRRVDATFPEPRPADVSLDTTRLASLLPGLDRPSIERAIVG